MKITDGLSRNDRIRRIDDTKPFSVIDNGIESLLRQTEEIARFIRYYDYDGTCNGYFDDFLKFLRSIRESGAENFIPDGNMEPAQALLYTFIRQLHDTGQDFNNRWRNFPDWYIDKILKVKAPRLHPDSAWVAFTKNIPDDVFIAGGTELTFSDADSESRILYRLVDDMTVSGVTVEKLKTLYFEHNPSISPARELGVLSSVQMRDVFKDFREGQMLFDTGDDCSPVQPLGLQISSPSLLLMEGKRIVTISVQFENLEIGFAHKRVLCNLRQKVKDVTGDVFLRMMNFIFFLEISTSQGWTKIIRYSLKDDYVQGKRGLVLKFELPETFPATVGCSGEIHGVSSDFPAVRILLNRDAWLFPYFWLKNLTVSRILIDTDVEGITDILFYNDLGRADTSAPFAPFGVNTGRGAYFTLGNYEMAVKHLLKMSVHIRWQQIPDDPEGMAGYYSAYKDERIDNRSFRVSSYFLKDYNWVSTAFPNSYYLFSTIVKERDGTPMPGHKLSGESVFKDIPLDKMKPFGLSREKYEYTVSADSGFVHFILESPAMGLGEKKYRQLFQDSIFEKAVKKKNVALPNPPADPLIERIMLSYTSHDEIDVMARNSQENCRLHHIYPLGIIPIYPNNEHRPLPFIFSMPADANILFGLKNVKGGECVNFYIDFFPQKREICKDDFPVVSWYWGDGYNWRRLPDDALLKDTTQNLVIDGLIRIYIPELSGNKQKDENGILWLCAGIFKNEKSVSAVRSIYMNAGRVFRNAEQLDIKRPDNFKINFAEDSLSGISEIKQIAPFSKGVEHEDGKDKLIRVSEYISHRGNAVTARDYERLALQAFPGIRKVKCLPSVCQESGTGKAVVSLAVIPYPSCDEDVFRPKAGTELLLEVASFFKTRTSEYIVVSAVNPVYEEVIIVSAVRYADVPHNRANIRNIISRTVNMLIASWQYSGAEPVFGYSFTVKEIALRIGRLKGIEKVEKLSVIQLIPRRDGKFDVREYDMERDGNERVMPVNPHGILIPGKEHIIKNIITVRFGVGEMKINENFIVWPEETAKR